ncbi:MAG: DNA gyrase inhibitor YacG [Gluconacetobacter diazotrophicus]|nr:DNA gyrase inhibitor YacG [Gluconacetobacter diazotrophicus]
MTDPVSPSPPPVARCPICERPSLPRFHPFCSLRCADADLGRWFTGQYRVPGPPADEDADRPLDPDGSVR